MSYKANSGVAELIDDGTYKATVLSVEEKDNFNKTAKQLVITWKLSNGREFFDRVSKDKDNSGEYNHFKIGMILYALRIEEIDSTDDLLTKLVGKSCKMTITHLFSEAKQGDYNSVKSYDIDLEEEAKTAPAPAKEDEDDEPEPVESDKLPF
jgi:hypothetical protein